MRPTVISETGIKDKFGGTLVNCLCECGATFTARRCDVLSGRRKSCGCARFKHKENLCGRKFHYLKVESYHSTCSQGRKWLCKCRCGKKVSVLTSKLINGHTKSCGCYRSELGIGRNKSFGQITGSYWNSIVCAARSRGLALEISIADAWNKFEQQNGKCKYTGSTLSLSKGKRTASLDRIDNQKGYTIDNIQWVHKRINIMKNNMSEPEFLDWCHLVSSHSQSKRSKNDEAVAV